VNRLDNEIAHGRFVAAHGAGEVWNWEGPAGRLRWERRVQMLGVHLRPGMTILELGCATGYFTGELARSGAEIVAIDVSPELLEIARANYSAPNDPFDFLHPKTPVALIDRANALGRLLENVPLISEFAGSLYIRAIK